MDARNRGRIRRWVRHLMRDGKLRRADSPLICAFIRFTVGDWRKKKQKKKRASYCFPIKGH